MVLSASGAIDPYGQVAGNLLKPLQSGLAELAREVADFFYDSLSGLENTAVILRRLRPAEYQSLKDKQAQHVMLLLSEGLQQADHQSEARRAGLAHAMVGVEILWLVKAYNLYQDEIYRFLLEHIADSSSRETLMRIVSQRIMLDLEGQVASYRKVSREITSAFVRFDQHVMSASNLTDVVRGALEIIGDLSGDISAFFARADDQGELQIEQSCGAAADQYHMAMEAGTVPRISIDAEITAGLGPGGRAWRSGEIIVSDAWLIESDKAPWRHLGEKLGFRSSAAVPLLDESGRAIALLSLYSRWPGFF